MAQQIEEKRMVQLRKKFARTRDILKELPKENGDVIWVDFYSKKIVGIMRDITIRGKHLTAKD